MARGYIHVEVNLEEFDDDDLIDELEERGYTVIDRNKLTRQQVLIIMDKFAGAKPGTDEYEIREAMRMQL